MTASHSLFKKALIFIMLMIFGTIGISVYKIYTTVPHIQIATELNGTLPASLKPVTLLVTGDVGKGDDDQYKVAKLLENLCQKYDPQGVLLVGDNFYPAGVTSTHDAQWQDKFEKPYSSPCLKTKNFYPVLGNHDYKGNAQAQIDYTQVNKRWNLPSRYYVLHFNGYLDLFAFDSVFPDVCGSARMCSLDWLRAQMKHSNAPWKIAMAHHPLWSGGYYAHPNGLAYFILPWFVCNSGIDFYFSGHEHSFQHLKSNPTQKCPVEQFILGVGGADLYPVKDLPHQTLFARSEWGAGVVTVTPQQLQFEFYGVTNPSAPLYITRNSKQKVTQP